MKTIKTKCLEGVCPLCGCTDLNYDARDIDDNGGTQGWTCTECGATGEEGYDLVFDGNHYNVQDADGNEYEIDQSDLEKAGTLQQSPVATVTIFVLERNNPENTPEPEVFTDGKEALRIVKEEYQEVMKEQEKVPGNFDYTWMFENDGVGSAEIESYYSPDCWQWRITEHVVALV